MNTPNRATTAPSSRSAAALLGLAVLLGASLMLSACNTTAGVGQDISAGGKDLSKVAVDTKSKL
jgi:predicted small secreted protein